jgi:hypothetical protein
MGDQPALTAREREDLTQLRHNWSAVYEISYTPPSAWSARRLDDRAFIQLPTAWQLRQWIREDHAANPVPRGLGTLPDGA